MLTHFSIALAIVAPPYLVWRLLKWRRTRPGGDRSLADGGLDDELSIGPFWSLEAAVRSLDSQDATHELELLVAADATLDGRSVSPELAETLLADAAASLGLQITDVEQDPDGRRYRFEPTRAE